MNDPISYPKLPVSEYDVSSAEQQIKYRSWQVPTRKEGCWKTRNSYGRLKKEPLSVRYAEILVLRRKLLEAERFNRRRFSIADEMIE
jgi:hypothetical protein